jgi:hypothetical protein
LGGLSRRELLCGFLVGAVSLAANCAIALRQGIPQPRVQDEFGYLLAADTFAHGRLTNPTPLFWEHFEAPHVLMRPTYMSKYPPGQGAALALGQVLAGAPIIGVWLSAAAAAVGIYWMLLGFVPSEWALLGGIVGAIHPQMLAWGQVYWGGSVAIFGAALMLGAWGRLMRQTSVPATIVLAIGLGVLANTRPYEGLVLSIPLMAGLLIRIVRRPNPWRALLPVSGTLLVIVAWMGYYNFRVTRSALRMPFVEYSAQYDVYPKFWFLPARPPPVYRNDVMRRLHTEWERGDYERMRTLRGLCAVSLTRLWQFIAINAQPWILLIPLLAAVALGRNACFQWVWLAMGVFLAGIWAEAWLLPHYAAPAIPVVLLLMVAGWQRLAKWHPGNSRVGQILVFAIFCGFVVGVIAWAAQLPRTAAQRFGRLDLIASTQLRSGRHLVFVRYLPGHLLDDEWVYNGADLEHSNIIWARAMGESDMPLIHSFTNRQIWLLDVGKDDLSLNRYRAGD